MRLLIVLLLLSCNVQPDPGPEWCSSTHLLILKQLFNWECRRSDRPQWLMILNLSVIPEGILTNVRHKLSPLGAFCSDLGDHHSLSTGDWKKTELFSEVEITFFRDSFMEIVK